MRNSRRLRQPVRLPGGSIKRSTIALLAAALILTDVGASMSALSKRQQAAHRARPAPQQAWGSAAGQPHLVGSPRRRSEVKTLRARYPLRPVAAAPKPKPNQAKVTTAPTRPTRFDPRASRLLPQRHGAYDRTYANPDGNLTTEVSAEPVNYRRPDGELVSDRHPPGARRRRGRRRHPGVAQRRRRGRHPARPPGRRARAGPAGPRRRPRGRLRPGRRGRGRRPGQGGHRQLPQRPPAGRPAPGDGRRWAQGDAGPAVSGGAPILRVPAAADRPDGRGGRRPGGADRRGRPAAGGHPARLHDRLGHRGRRPGHLDRRGLPHRPDGRPAGPAGDPGREVAGRPGPRVPGPGRPDAWPRPARTAAWSSAAPAPPPGAPSCWSATSAGPTAPPT